MESCKGRRRRGFVLSLVFALVILQGYQVRAMPSQLRTLRLCSRSLSDALFLVCKDRGYNEPFLYSEEMRDNEERQPFSTTSEPPQGLVQECCLRSCSYKQLESYCKPLPQPSRQDDAATRGNSIGSKSATSRKIVRRPSHPSVKEQRRKSRKNRRKKQQRKICKCRRRPRPGERRYDHARWRKVSRETVIPKVPAFQVGTTSPEPIDSIVIFPFKSELSLGRVDDAVGEDQEDLAFDSRSR